MKRISEKKKEKGQALDSRDENKVAPRRAGAPRRDASPLRFPTNNPPSSSSFFAYLTTESGRR